MNIFITIFIILTIMHPIADFWFGRNRKLHYFVALNPLHWLWDISPFRRHQNYSKTKSVYWDFDDHGIDPLTRENTGYKESLVVHPYFWKFLAVDQYNHVILNLIFATFVAFLTNRL